MAKIEFSIITRSLLLIICLGVETCFAPGARAGDAQECREATCTNKTTDYIGRWRSLLSAERYSLPDDFDGIVELFVYRDPFEATRLDNTVGSDLSGLERTPLMFEVSMGTDPTPRPLGHGSCNNGFFPGAIALLGEQFTDACKTSHGEGFFYNSTTAPRDALVEMCTSSLLQQFQGYVSKKNPPMLDDKGSADGRSLCPHLIPVFDMHPFRSPLAVADFLLDKVAGRSYVEIGARNGDIAACLAPATISSVVLEMDTRYCPVLRSRELGAVVCEGLTAENAERILPTADIYFTWITDDGDEDIVKIVNETLRARGKRATLYGRVSRDERKSEASPSLWTVDVPFDDSEFSMFALRDSSCWEANIGDHRDRGREDGHGVFRFHEKAVGMAFEDAVDA
eukprot:CAMPEP_0172628658 /NCGR_PEP_ID=MMETSP1068-20121228/163104_1 /TAXON_ID=35684 /ORGANISM="Pseudopedinella elastica, Strain CCMP716" /LENGTH=396 /DNA_ID=CAMNT_0013438939 /DNA_START=174 /DNA_END=1364 /DNA_ORIENTATION=+